jgi:hypothetical protein
MNKMIRVKFLKWPRLVFAGVGLAITLAGLEVHADVIYRETFGRPNGSAGNINPTNFQWALFTNGIVRTDGYGISPNIGNPTNVANVNAGPNSDGSFTNCAIGLNYQDIGAGTNNFTFTPEYSFNPATYSAGSIVFSWYEGNASTVNTYQVAVQIGGTWYVSAQTFANTIPVTSGGNFGTQPNGGGGAQPMSLTYNPTAANWKLLNFNGNYATNNGGLFTNSSVGLTLGAAATSDLSGTITAFGLFGQQNGAVATMRFDTFAISATIASSMVAVVTNLPATGVQGTYATLNGQIVSIGSQTPVATLYYGLTDGGTNAAGWDNTVNLGLQNGSFNYAASGLTTNTTYYYTIAATNAAGNSWATPSQTFTTQTTDPTNSPTFVQYLSGTDKDHTVPWQFSVSSEQNSGIATNIPVPSCWQSMGFGAYGYTQNTGGGMVRSNSETGFYTNTFSVPSTWTGKEIFLVFEGAMTDTSASINGHSVGATHQGGYYEFRYDVTPYVVVGANTNVLTVTVRMWSANASVEAAEQGNVDYWLFGGIYRPVYLEAKPSAYIDYVAANPLANGNITNNVYLGGITANYTVQEFVTDSNNVMLGNVFSNTVTAGATNVTLSASLPTPNVWSSESPTLYTLNVQLVDSHGTVVHTVTNEIGFRTITFVPQQGFFVNGKKVVMRGICHHEEWPTTGRTSSDLQNSNDVAMMKDMNFNSVRESHYPEDKTFLDECNRQGLYVLEEMDSYQNQIDLTDGISHVYEMIRRDVSDPCIIAWDNGNETSWSGSLGDLDGNNAGSTNYYDLFDIQNREVIHPGANGGSFMSLFDYHYPPTFDSFTNNLGTNKPAFSCTEILHSLYDGGGGAGLQDYWDAERVAPNGVGMWTWSWDDEGVIRTDQGGIMDVRGSSAPDGIVGPYREKEASYYSYKKIYSPVQISAPDPAAFAGTLAVTNRFDFTDLSQCSFNWQLGWFFDATDPTNNFSTNALVGGMLVGTNSGNFSGPALPPGSGIGSPGSLTLPSFPANWTNYDALRLTATDPYGNNIYTWTWPLHTPAQVCTRIVGAVSASAPAITAGTNATEIIVTNGPRIFHFSSSSGVINSLTVSNVPVSFTNGPLPASGSAWTVTSITNYTDGTNYYIGVNSLASPTNAFLWTLRPDGWLKLNYQYWLTGTQSYFGITFSYPSNNVTAMNWLGQGPYRVWKNRSAGQEIFTHTKSYNFPWTGQSTNYGANFGKPTTQWTYPEFEGYHGQLYWANLQTTEQPITIVTPTTNLFLRVFTPPTTDQANTYRDPPFPPGGISLLHGISAIGDKFHLPANTSPAGATNIANGLYTGEANFFFGALPPSDADRDNNGLTDAWELKYFGALGQDAFSRADVDGLPLMFENAFDLSPTNNNLGSPRLPHFANGIIAPVALVYTVVAAESDFFDYIPQLSDDLMMWIGSDQHPEYFAISPNANGADTIFTVQPIPAAWPGDASHLFLRLKIKPKP